MDEKPCRLCGVSQPLSEFHRAKGMQDGHRNECKTCFRRIARARYRADPQKAIAAVKRWQDENPEHVRAYQAEYRNRPERKRAMRDLYYRRTYGISAEEADVILDAQNGRCAICCKPAPERLASMHLDHDHRTGEIRGFLCVDCNHGLGKLGDSPDRLLRALIYLRQHGSATRSATSA
jgi:hypothetical protein